MEGRTWPFFFWNHERFFQTLAAQIVIVHFRQVVEKNQIIIRFENGYGVIILPISQEKDDEIFEMLVLKFYGPKINDYQVTQYAPICELNRGNFDEITDLCKQVSLLSKIQATKASSVQSKAKVIKGERERQCSNSLCLARR